MLLCAATLSALLVIGGVGQNPGPGVEIEIVCKYCAVGVGGIYNREHNATCVDAGSTTAVETSRFK
jgi:hypothetical protein